MRRFLIPLVCLLLPGGLFAQIEGQQGNVAPPSITDYQADASDPAIQMLYRIFGGANGIFGEGSGGWFGDSLFALNLGIMAVAIAWFSWNALAAVTQGSFDGEFLGKRQSTVWVPIRLTTGMVLLAPVWGGWALAQLSMAYATTLGVGIANSTASHTSQAWFPLATPVANLPSAQSVMSKMEPGWSCILQARMDIVRNLESNTDAAEPSLHYVWNSKSYASDLAVGVKYGVIPATEGKTDTECGNPEWALGDVSGESGEVAAAITQGNAAFKTVIAGMDSDMKALYAEASAIREPDNRVLAMEMEKHLAEQKEEIVSRWQSYIDSAKTSALSKEKSAIEKEIKDSITKYGWLGAGAASASSVISAITVTAKSPAGKKGDNESSYIRESDFCGNAAYISSPIKCTKDAITGLTTKPIARINHDLKTGLINSVSGGPFTAAPRLGASILNFVTEMFGLSVAVFGLIAVIGVVLGAIPAIQVGPAFTVGVGRVASTYFGVFFGVAIPLVLFSLQLLIMIPASIMVAWIFAVGAWLVIVAESIIASPLWAMAHLDTDGEGMGQRTSHGYIFYLNLLFRPAILVIVVGFAYAFAETLGEFGNSLIKPFVSGLVTSDQLGFLAQWILLLGGLWLLVQVNMKVAGVAASLLSLIPTQIFTWIGGHFGSDVGSGIEGHVESGFSHGAGSAGGALHHATNRGMGELDRKVGEMDRDLDRQREKDRETASLTPGTEAYENAVQKEMQLSARRVDIDQRLSAGANESGSISGTRSGGGGSNNTAAGREGTTSSRGGGGSSGGTTGASEGGSISAPRRGSVSSGNTAGGEGSTGNRGGDSSGSSQSGGSMGQSKPSPNKNTIGDES